MAAKRKNDSDEPTARDRKKAKLATARTIDVQPATEPPSASGQNAVAGPSRVITMDSEFILCFSWRLQTTSDHLLGMKSLPNSIDVEKFAEVRGLYIRSTSRYFSSRFYAHIGEGF
jgi:hypothetical protein